MNFQQKVIIMGSTYHSKRINKHYRYTVSRNRASRPKTFKTEAAAKKWAEANKITNYKLENLKSPENKDKKFRVVAG